MLACDVLHNLCIVENIPLIEEDVEEDDFGMYQVNDNEEMTQNRQNPELVAGFRFRQNIVNRLFTD